MTSTRSRHALALGAVLLVVAISGTVLDAPANGAVPPTPARAAAGWLDRLASASVPLKGFDGVSDDWGVTLDAGLALVAAGAPDASADRILTALVAGREAAVAPGGVDNPGRLGRALMFAVSVNEDPRAFGAAPGNDLVARLEALRALTGPDTGLFGSSVPLFDGVFRQGYALMGLVAAGATVPIGGVGWLVSQQCADGSWMPYRSDITVPCARNDALFVGPDSNSTAVAVEALAATGTGAAARAAGVEWLWRNRNTDGGWGFFPGDPSDPNSTALATQALLAVGGADDERWSAGPVTPPEALAAFQLGCEQPEADRGALTFPDTGDQPNSFATAQGVPALAGLAFPLGPVPAGEPLEPLVCEPPSSSSSVPDPTSSSVPDPTSSSVPDPTSSTVPDPTSSTVPEVVEDRAVTSTTAAPTAAPSVPTTSTPGTTVPPPPAVLGATLSRTAGSTRVAGTALATTGTSVVALVLLGAGLVLCGLALRRPSGRRH